MNLVVSREDKQKDTTDFYVIDELHDLFASHIDEVMAHPVEGWRICVLCKSN